MAPKAHRLTIDLERDIYKRLKALADSEERTVSKQGKTMIIQALERYEVISSAQQKPPPAKPG